MSSSTVKVQLLWRITTQVSSTKFVQNSTKPDVPRGCQRALSRSVENEDLHSCATVDVDFSVRVCVLLSRREHKGYVLELKPCRNDGSPSSSENPDSTGPSKTTTRFYKKHKSARNKYWFVWGCQRRKHTKRFTKGIVPSSSAPLLMNVQQLPPYATHAAVTRTHRSSNR